MEEAWIRLMNPAWIVALRDGGNELARQNSLVVGTVMFTLFAFAILLMVAGFHRDCRRYQERKEQEARGLEEVPEVTTPLELQKAA